jgi:hypothetical protein
MATATKKPARTCRLADDMLTITVGKEFEQYAIAEVERQGTARSFTVRRLESPGRDAETYTTTICTSGRNCCTCKGNQRWGYCRHCQALEALVNAKRL